ncbi:MAG: aldo/keto reductase [Cenarchaeum sp. SB0663_bin_5]|nr:aldo/keto reductase [Cenarchaeum sp. SB0663_bin_5]MYH04263.1 aldo/keto reductase [Cenarchaeum sp. SB0675_bin_21]MYL10941.1 aldo/keto reductase [Cenarchaeum sp. SB0669_bin_11]
MKYRRLGNTDIQISEIGFGAWTIALDWWGKKIDESEAKRMIKKAYDCGINFFETADMYGKGKSERLLGEALEGVRDDVVISTKYGYDFSSVEQIGHAELPQRFDVEFTKKALRSSLERLRTDRIEMYGLHNPKMNHIRSDEPFNYLSKLIHDGTIQTLQVALGPAIGWLDEGMAAMVNKNVGAIQTVYNILEQTPGNELLSEAEKRGSSILVRVPDASGILTGKITADTKIPKNDHRRDRKIEWRMAALKKVEQLRPIADENGLNITELAIKFILSQNAVGAVLPTVVDSTEIETFSEISDGKYLSQSDMAEISQIYSSWPSYKLKSSIA